VPRKTVGELRKLLDDADGAIDVRCPTPRSSSASRCGTDLQADRRQFPALERVIPSGNDKSLALEPGSSPVGGPRFHISADKTRAVKLNLTKDK